MASMLHVPGALGPVPSSVQRVRTVLSLRSASLPHPGDEVPSVGRSLCRRRAVRIPTDPVHPVGPWEAQGAPEPHSASHPPWVSRRPVKAPTDYVHSVGNSVERSKPDGEIPDTRQARE